jgi:hypothetical protein
VNDTNGQPRSLSVQYGRKRIDYALWYTKRKTLAIDVHPDLSVTVTAPVGSTDEAVGQRVAKRATCAARRCCRARGLNTRTGPPASLRRPPG